MSALAYAAWSLPLGAALDLMVGDPRGWPHPVGAIGGLVGLLERALRRLITAIGGGSRLERLAGVVLALVVATSTGLAAWAIVAACDWAGPVPSLVGRSLLI